MRTLHVPTINVRGRRFATQVQCSLLALVLINVCASRAMAQDSHEHKTAPKQNAIALGLQDGLIKVVRDATARYADVNVAKAEGYALQFGCVSGSDEGAMGLHYVNGNLVNAGVLDPTRPQIIIYEALPDGTLEMTGADFLVIKSQWDASHDGPPEMMGQFFHLFDAPNRFGLPAFYTLHVWAWKDNPKGAFTNWHPNVSCSSFNPKKP